MKTGVQVGRETIDIPSFEVKPRTKEQGEGWQLFLRDGDGLEIGGGVFQSGDDGYCDAYNTGADWLSSMLGDDDAF